MTVAHDELTELEQKLKHFSDTALHCTRINAHLVTPTQKQWAAWLWRAKGFYVDGCNVISQVAQTPTSVVGALVTHMDVDPAPVPTPPVATAPVDLPESPPFRVSFVTTNDADESKAGETNHPGQASSSVKGDMVPRRRCGTRAAHDWRTGRGYHPIPQNLPYILQTAWG